MNQKLERLKAHNPEGALIAYLQEVEERLAALENKKAVAKEKKK